MPRIRQFKLPALGEGLTEGGILQWLVRPGGEVTLNQPIVEVAPAALAVEPETFVGTGSAEGTVGTGLIGGSAPDESTSVLVGYGPRSVAAKRRTRKAPRTTGDVATEAVSMSDLAHLGRPGFGGRGGRRRPASGR